MFPPLTPWFVVTFLILASAVIWFRADRNSERDDVEWWKRAYYDMKDERDRLQEVVNAMRRVLGKEKEK